MYFDDGTFMAEKLPVLEDAREGSEGQRVGQ